MKPIKTYTKESLIEELKEIRNKGWIPNARLGNDGAVGNTLEDLLEIEENNLPIPNAAEWELKTQQKDTTSLLTLFHSEPSPRAMKFVPNILLPKYGWKHQQAGKKYPSSEMSFRQTFNSQDRTDRGFTMIVDRKNEKICVSFDANSVDKRHKKWLDRVKSIAGLGELNPQPYWGFDDLFHKIGTKLLNCFFIVAERKKIGGVEHFHYTEMKILQGLSKNRFVCGLEEGIFYLDFDARTGHNHGTKIRMKRNCLAKLYEKIIEI
ncbi:MvaI/BcnI family restriction endonuclease [Candidatus Mycalebacterium sp.]